MLDSGLWTGRSGLDAGRWTTTGFSAQSTTGVSFYYVGMASGQWDQWHGPAGCRMSFLLRAGNRYRTLRCANRSINYQYNFSFGPPPGLPSVEVPSDLRGADFTDGIPPERCPVSVLPTPGKPERAAGSKVGTANWN